MRFNRPERRNAISTQLGHDMLDVFSALVADTQDYRCVILTGAGDKAFGAGADLKERNGMSNETWLKQHALFERMTLALLDCPIPVIAAVNGVAYAGSCELALTCDFIYASTTARFALTEITLGIMPGGGGTQLLPRAVGSRRAKEIILTGKPFSAEEALAWGVVNKLCAPDKLMDGDAGDRYDDRQQRADFGAAGQALDPFWRADGSALRAVLRDRRLQQDGRHRRPPRRRAGLQREAQAEVQGKII